MLFLTALWIVVLAAVAVAGPASTGFPAATVSVLEVLWQVQGTSVSLVFALVLFVFGLLPGGRGRLTYREFLRRTHAVGLTLFNIGALLFNGLRVQSFPPRSWHHHHFRPPG
jgi:NO-binding membrane sensor protein with MHYT domain